jgi:hypothetical protein
VQAAHLGAPQGELHLVATGLLNHGVQQVDPVAGRSCEREGLRLAPALEKADGQHALGQGLEVLHVAEMDGPVAHRLAGQRYRVLEEQLGGVVPLGDHHAGVLGGRLVYVRPPTGGEGQGEGKRHRLSGSHGHLSSAGGAASGCRFWSRPVARSRS